MASTTLTPVTEPIPDTLVASVERLSVITEWTSLRIGEPPAGDEPGWIPYSDLVDPAAVQRIVRTRAGQGEYAQAKTPEAIVGNYLFRDFIHAPLEFAGYLWARERRVPRLAGALAVQDTEWIQHWRWLDPAAVAIDGDPVAGNGPASLVPDVRSLNEALFEEVRRFSEPLLDAFRANKYVAVANGWGSILDAVAYGVQLAGKRDKDLGSAGAWSRWEAAIEGRTFPVRRRPRRLMYAWAPGADDEVLVRAGCCLWYMTDEAKGAEGETDYCTSCYLKTDEKRIANLIEWKQQEAAGEGEAH